ncbi:hypothetical protein D3C78_1558010 [compost metagenome]
MAIAQPQGCDGQQRQPGQRAPALLQPVAAAVAPGQPADQAADGDAVGHLQRTAIRQLQRVRQIGDAGFQPDIGQAIAVLPAIAQQQQLVVDAANVGRLRLWRFAVAP